MGRDREEDERFVVAHTSIASPALLPELRLHLATEVTPLWHATEAWLHEQQISPPFRAFAWAGGQGVARFVLDHPETVRGKRVLDFACGSGLVAIAAAMAGAASVVAVDLDPLAIAATACNARSNGVVVEAAERNCLGETLEAIDVVLAGDVFYDAAMTASVLPWLRRCAGREMAVFVGDPHRAYAPSDGLEELARFDVSGVAAVEGSDSRATRVMRVEARLR